MTLRVLPARVEDAEALTDLHLDVWDEAYGSLVDPAILRARRERRAERVASWTSIIAAGSSANLLAWDDERLVGFSSTGTGRDPDDDLPPLELMGLYVRASSYGLGVGFALLTEAIGGADAYLWVLDGNERAISFYERQGFAFDGSTKPEDVGLERRMVRRG